MQPATLPGTFTDEERAAILGRLYKVLLHNDDRNTMEHVVKCLIRVFGFSEEVAFLIMEEAHRAGVALCVVEPLERAEMHRDQLISLSLTSTIEPE